MIPTETQRAIGAALACEEPALHDAAMEMLQEILAAGATIEEAASTCWVPYRTLKRWLALPGVRHVLIP